MNGGGKKARRRARRFHKLLPKFQKREEPCENLVVHNKVNDDDVLGNNIHFGI